MVADINDPTVQHGVEAMPDRFRFQKMDVTKQQDWQHLIEATQDAYGGIDCLVNNAGTTYRNKVNLPQP